LAPQYALFLAIVRKTNANEVDIVTSRNIPLTQLSPMGEEHGEGQGSNEFKCVRISRF
jgi:hypothetical protein